MQNKFSSSSICICLVLFNISGTYILCIFGMPVYYGFQSFMLHCQFESFPSSSTYNSLYIVDICLVQIYLRKENNPASVMEGTLLAVGGRYDYLLNRLWARDYVGYALITWLLTFHISSGGTAIRHVHYIFHFG